METRNLLKEFFEEQLQTDWGVKFKELTYSDRRIIEKMLSFSLWKMRAASKDLVNIFISTFKEYKKFNIQLKEISKLFGRHKSNFLSFHFPYFS